MLSTGLHFASESTVDVRHEREARFPIHSRRSRSRLATSASRRLQPSDERKQRSFPDFVANGPIRPLARLPEWPYEPAGSARQRSSAEGQEA